MSSDARAEAQMRTYVKFVNLHLSDDTRVSDLSELGSSEKLFELMASIYRRRGYEFPLRREKRTAATLRRGEHILELNDLSKVLKLISQKRSLVGIDAHQIERGNKKSLMAVVWHVILQYFVWDEDDVGRGGRRRSPYADLAAWTNATIAPRHGRVPNLEKWRSGGKDAWSTATPLYKLIDTLTVDDESDERRKFMADAKAAMDNPTELAKVCVDFADGVMGIPKLIDENDFSNLEERSVTTYLSYFRNFAKKKLDDLQKRKSYALGLEKDLSGLQDALKKALFELEQSRKAREADARKMQEVVDALRREMGEQKNSLERAIDSRDTLASAVDEKTQKVSDLLRRVEERDRTVSGLSKMVEELKETSASQRDSMKKELNELRKDRDKAEELWRGKNRDLMDVIQKNDDQLAVMSREKERFEALVDEANKKALEEKEGAKLREDELKRRQTGLEDDISSRKEEISDLRKRLREQEDEILQGRRANDDHVRELEDLRSEKDRIAGELEKFTSRKFVDCGMQVAVDANHKIVQTDPYFEDLLEKKQRELDVLSRENASVKNKLEKKSKAFADLSDAHDQTLSELRQLQVDNLDLKGAKEHVERELQELRSDYDHFRSKSDLKKDSLMKQRDQWKAMLDSKVEDMRKLQDDLASTKDKLKDEEDRSHHDKLAAQDKSKKLEDRIQELESKLKKSMDDGESLSEDKDRQLANLQDLLEASKKNFDALKARGEQAEERWESIQKSKEAEIEELKGSLAAREKELLARLGDVEKEVEVQRKRIHEVESDNAALKADHERTALDWEKERDQLMADLAKETGRRESLEVDLSGAKEDAAKQRALLADSEAANKELSEKLKATEDEKLQKEKELHDLGAERDELSASLRRKDEAIAELERMKKGESDDAHSRIDSLTKEKDRWRSLLSQRDAELSTSHASLEAALQASDELKQKQVAQERKIRDLEEESATLSASLSRSKNDASRANTLVDEKDKRIRDLEDLLYETNSNFEKFKLRNKLKLKDIESSSTARDAQFAELEQRLDDARKKHLSVLDDWKAKEDSWRGEKLRMQDEQSEEVKSWRGKLRSKDLELTEVTETAARERQKLQHLVDSSAEDIRRKEAELLSVEGKNSDLVDELAKLKRTSEEEAAEAKRKIGSLRDEVDDQTKKLAAADAEMSRLRESASDDLEGWDKEKQELHSALQKRKDHEDELEGLLSEKTRELSDLQRAFSDAKDEAHKKQRDLESERDRTQRSLEDLELKHAKALKEWEAERSGLKTEIEDLTNRLDSTEKDLKATQAERDRLSAELERMKKRLSSHVADSEKTVSEMTAASADQDKRIKELLFELEESRKTHADSVRDWEGERANHLSDLADSSEKNDLLQRQLAKLNQDMQDLTQLKDSLRESLAKSEATVEDLKKDQAEKESQWSKEKSDYDSKLQVSASELSDCKEKFRVSKDELSTKLKASQDANKELELLAEESSKQLDDLSSQLQQRDSQMVDLRKDCESLEGDLAEMRKDDEVKLLKIDALESSVSDLKMDLEKQRLKGSELGDQHSRLASEKADLEEAAAQEIAGLEKERDVANERIASLEKKAEEEDKKWRSLMLDKDAELSSARDDSQRQIAELKKMLQERDEEIVRLKARIAELERLLEEKEARLADSAKSIEGLQRDTSGLRSELASLQADLVSQEEKLLDVRNKASERERNLGEKLKKKDHDLSSLKDELDEKSRKMTLADEQSRKLLKDGEELRLKQDSKFAEMQKMLKDKLRNSEEEQESLLSQLEESQTMITSMQSEAEDRAKEMESLREDLSLARESFDDLLRDKEDEAETGRQKMAALKVENDRLMQEKLRELAELQRALKEREADGSELQSRFDDLDKLSKARDQEFHDLKSAYDEMSDDLLQTQDAHSKQVKEMTDESSRLMKELEKRDAEYQDLESTLERQNERCDSLESDVSESRRAARQAELAHKSAMGERDAELDSLRQQLEDSEKLASELDRLRQKIRGQSEEMDSMKDDFEKQMESRFMHVTGALSARDEEVEGLLRDVAEKDRRIRELEEEIEKLREAMRLLEEKKPDPFMSVGGDMKLVDSGPPKAVEEGDKGLLDPFETVDSDMRSGDRPRSRSVYVASTPKRKFNSKKQTDRYFRETRDSYSLSRKKVMGLTQDDVREIGGYRQPAPLVHDIVKSVLMLVSNRTSFQLGQWKVCRRYMQRRVDFLRLVRGFTPTAGKDVAEIRKILATIPKKNVARTSKCAAVLYEFAVCAVKLIIRMKKDKSSSRKRS